MTTAERLNLIESKIKDKHFLENTRCGNEIKFYIFDYEPKDEFLVREHLSSLKDKINSESSELTMRTIDLYELLLECLSEKGYLEKSLAAESKFGSEKLIEAIKNTIGLKMENNMLIKKIVDQIEKNDVIFLTGVGKIFPIIRSHKILNNLFPFITKNPLILAFPGSYTGYGLVLFNEISGDNYYRAFKLI